MVEQFIPINGDGRYRFTKMDEKAIKSFRPSMLQRMVNGANPSIYYPAVNSDGSYGYIPLNLAYSGLKFSGATADEVDTSVKFINDLAKNGSIFRRRHIKSRGKPIKKHRDSGFRIIAVDECPQEPGLHHLIPDSELCELSGISNSELRALFGIDMADYRADWTSYWSTLPKGVLTPVSVTNKTELDAAVSNVWDLVMGAIGKKKHTFPDNFFDKIMADPPYVHPWLRPNCRCVVKPVKQAEPVDEIISDVVWSNFQPEEKMNNGLYLLRIIRSSAGGEVTYKTANLINNGLKDFEGNELQHFILLTNLATPVVVPSRYITHYARINPPATQEV